jgi:predicted  nucleic acid-binding Zn-ribbon protein
VDIDVTNIELQEWNKILNRLENMLKAEVDENKADDIRKDIERAKKAIADLSTKK